MTVTLRSEVLTLDPVEVALTSRDELDLHSGAIRVNEAGPDWGQYEIDAFMAKRRFGEVPLDSSLPNRIVTIPLILGATGDFDAARLALQAKVTRFNDDRCGWVKRELLGGATYGAAGARLYLDVVKATLTMGGSTMQASYGVDADVVLTLECLPDFYGDEVVGSTKEITGGGVILEQVPGNLPARTQIHATDKSAAANQQGLAWHARRRHYSALPTAAPFYEAEALTPLDLAASESLTGASGGKVLKHSKLSTAWTPVMSTNLLAGDYLTHEGTYDVWARAYTTSLTPPWVRLLWGVGDITSPNQNLQVQLPGSNGFYLVYLGQISVLNTGLGPHRWQGLITGRGAAGGENVSIDRLAFFCADEGTGVLRAPLSFDLPLTGYLMRDEFNQAEAALNAQPLDAIRQTAGPNNCGTAANDASAGVKAWASPTNAQGAEDGVFTHAEVKYGEATPTYTNYLKATNFGLAIPEGGLITGIKFDAVCSGMVFGGATLDSLIRPIKAGTILTGGGSELAYGGSWIATYLGAGLRTWGGETNMLGTTWTPAQVNASNFGLAICAQIATNPPEGFFPGEPGGASVDCVKVSIYYTDPAGLKWVTSGDAVDLTVIGSSHTVKRSEVSDASINQGRYAIAGTGSYVNVLAGMKCKRQASAPGGTERIQLGALIRYTDENNWLMGCYDFVNASGTGTEFLRILKRKEGGTPAELISVPLVISTSSPLWRYVWIEANSQGRVLLWAVTSEVGVPQLIGATFHTDLATGGKLATGKVGFYDVKVGATANTREYDSFQAWVPSHDAVINRSTTALLTSSGHFRYSADGSGIGAVPYPGSDLPRLPVSGPEEMPVEVALLNSRGDFGVIPDSSLDALSVALTYRPCWSHVPGIV